MLANRVAMVSGSKHYDKWNTPGAKNLIAGTMMEGFFGEASSAELITGDALASLVGLSDGVSQHSTAGWLKYAFQNKIEFIAKRPFRYNLSWDDLNYAKCVYGNKTVVVQGKTYKIRLIRGLNIALDPKSASNGYNDSACHNSEWNRLICRVHEEAVSGNWKYFNNIESGLGAFLHTFGGGSGGMYNNDNINVLSCLNVNPGNAKCYGRFSWCQEISSIYQVGRGQGGVSDSSRIRSNYLSFDYGWRPVLELVP